MINSIVNTGKNACLFAKNFATSPDLLFGDCTTLAKKALANFAEKLEADAPNTTLALALPYVAGTALVTSVILLVTFLPRFLSFLGLLVTNCAREFTLKALISDPSAMSMYNLYIQTLNSEFEVTVPKNDNNVDKKTFAIPEHSFLNNPDDTVEQTDKKKAVLIKEVKTIFAKAAFECKRSYLKVDTSSDLVINNGAHPIKIPGLTAQSFTIATFSPSEQPQKEHA